MPFHAGQTYLYPLKDESHHEHLWIIASEPDAEGQFATASFTSLKGAKDQTVTFLRAEHAFIRHDTCILYALAEITTIDKLAANLKSGDAKMHQDVPAEMLKLILDGFTASDRTKARVREFVLAYKRARTGASGP